MNLKKLLFSILLIAGNHSISKEYSYSRHDNVYVSNTKNIERLDVTIHSFDTELGLYNVTYLYDYFIYPLVDNEKFQQKMNKMNKRNAAYFIEDSLEYDYLMSILTYFEMKRRRVKFDEKIERCLRSIESRVNELKSNIKRLKNNLDLDALNSIIYDNIGDNMQLFYEKLSDKDINDLEFATFLYFFDQNYIIYPVNNKLYDSDDYLTIIKYIASKSFGKMGIVKKDLTKNKGRMTILEYINLMSEKIGTITSTYY